MYVYNSEEKLRLCVQQLHITKLTSLNDGLEQKPWYSFIKDEEMRRVFYFYGVRRGNLKAYLANTVACVGQ